MWRSGILAALLALGLAAPAMAVQPDEILQDPKLEARARALSAGLRCLVCQNQSIDDSDAPLARDLRLLVRERLVAGDSDDQIHDFLVARYGEFVLLKPPFAWNTLLLWLMPLVALGVAGWAVAGSLKSSTSTDGAATALSPEEKERFDALLKDKSGQ
jgi:cytochrome c-type biogenesis protein CcmH